MYLNVEDHKVSVEAFIEYLKRCKPFEFSVLVRRMYYNIGWPIDSIAYVITQLNKSGFNYPGSRGALHKALHK